MSVQAVVFDIGNVLVAWNPVAFHDRDIGAEARARLFDETQIAPGSLLFTDDKPENIETAALRGWQVHLFEGPEGWAVRLVGAGLLTEEEAI